MLELFYQFFGKMCNLTEYISELEDSEFYTVLRQMDAINIRMEFNQWSDIIE
jgi:hypothetical protein